MRVCIDGTPLLLRSAGVKTYLFHWIRHLQRQSGKEAVRVFPFLDALGELDHERTTVALGSTWLRLLLLHLSNIRGNPTLTWLIRNLDLFHASNQVRNPPRSVRLTTTVHDLTCWIMPEMHRPLTVAADKLFAEQIVKRADGIIAVSESSRRDAIQWLDIPPDRIETIHSGVADAYFEAGAPEAAAVRAKHRLERPYLLFVGTIEPRKNIDTLIDAYENLSPSLREEFDLVVAGSIGWASDTTIARLRESSARYLAYVPEEDLPGLTAGATLCVYPSLYEGFGFPVAQSLATGVPVVTSNVSSLPEVAEDGGLLVDPRSSSEIRSAVEQLLLTPGLRQRLSQAARHSAARFRWEEAARKSWRFFEKVCGRP